MRDVATAGPKARALPGTGAAQGPHRRCYRLLDSKEDKGFVLMHYLYPNTPCVRPTEVLRDVERDPARRLGTAVTPGVPAARPCGSVYEMHQAILATPRRTFSLKLLETACGSSAGRQRRGRKFYVALHLSRGVQRRWVRRARLQPRRPPCWRP